MRHVYMRGFISLIWLVAAIVTGMSGRFEMAFLYVILGGLFLYSAYAAWQKNNRGGR